MRHPHFFYYPDIFPEQYGFLAIKPCPVSGYAHVLARRSSGYNIYWLNLCAVYPADIPKMLCIWETHLRYAHWKRLYFGFPDCVKTHAFPSQFEAAAPGK